MGRLGRGEAIAAVSGAALIAFMFLGWWGPPESIPGINGEVPDTDVPSISAWEGASFNDVIWFVTGAAALALGVLAATQTRPNLPVATSAIVTMLGALSLVLIVVRLIDPPGALGVDLSREIGVWLGLVAIVGIIVGAWTAMHDEGTTLAGQADSVRERVSADGEEPPAPPPPPPTSQPPGGPGPPA